ncbi:methionine aminopeptidase [Ornithinimicrobium avium]|uniref:Methionine aminopeptidase n=1 Tax=Ornithinimicrobium avium TaxID=2283195 RepID=A0A345NJ31_9MICO|nr:methionine aminopeptidase [Ornithinimicrobium avium]AXH95039.1 methionine aminopeptidase [Ornithinimicrobium avium]
MAAQYWFNTRTRQVEAGDDPERARSNDLLGPYDTQEEASRALEIAAARTEAWDEEERADDEWRTGDPQASDWDSNPLND